MNIDKLSKLIPILRTDSDFQNFDLLVRNRLISGVHEANEATLTYESSANPTWLNMYKGSKAASRWKPSKRIPPEDTYPLPKGWKWIRFFTKNREK